MSFSRLKNFKFSATEFIALIGTAFAAVLVTAAGTLFIASIARSGMRAAIPPVAAAPFIKARRDGSDTASTASSVIDAGAPVGNKRSISVALMGCFASAPIPIIPTGAKVSNTASIVAAFLSSGDNSESKALPVARIPRMIP